MGGGLAWVTWGEGKHGERESMDPGQGGGGSVTLPYD